MELDDDIVKFPNQLMNGVIGRKEAVTVTRT
jgi:hypothetical protein